MSGTLGYIKPERRITIGFSDGQNYFQRQREVVLVCIACHITFTGVARVGMPCSNCLEPIVDLYAEVAKKAKSYDPARELIDRLMINRY